MDFDRIVEKLKKLKGADLVDKILLRFFEENDIQVIETKMSDMHIVHGVKKIKKKSKKEEKKKLKIKWKLHKKSKSHSKHDADSLKTVVPTDVPNDHNAKDDRLI